MPETFFIAAQKLGGYLPKNPFVSFLLENSKSNTEVFQRHRITILQN